LTDHWLMQLLARCPGAALRLPGASSSILLHLGRARLVSAAAGPGGAAPAPASAAAAAAAAAFAPRPPPPQQQQEGGQRPAVRGGRQTLDYTALCACVQELQAQWVPSKVEEVRPASRRAAPLASARSAGVPAQARPASRPPLQSPWKHQQQARPRLRFDPPPGPTPSTRLTQTRAQVVQPDAYTLSLRLRTPARQGWLHLSWHPTGARVTAGGPPPRGAASEAFSFADAAGQALKGLVLVSARLPQPWERVAELAFGVRPGDPPSRLAYCEVQAKYSNLVLTDGGGTVLAAAHQVGGRQSSLRQVQQGRPYALPPVTAGVPPAGSEPMEAWRANAERAAALAAAPAAARSGGGGGGGGRPTVAGGCVRAYQGVSPALMEELCAAAGVDPGAHPQELTSAQWAALHGVWQGWLERVASGSFAATLDEAAGRSVGGGDGRGASGAARRRPLPGAPTSSNGRPPWPPAGHCASSAPLLMRHANTHAAQAAATPLTHAPSPAGPAPLQGSPSSAPTPGPLTQPTKCLRPITHPSRRRSCTRRCTSGSPRRRAAR
jgi:hypothetical protein